eukprot:COSAG04_NODE_5825_length_1483_cov_3.478324_1_plen_84_part_10
MRLAAALAVALSCCGPARAANTCHRGGNWPPPRPTRSYSLPPLPAAARARLRLFGLYNYACEIPSGAEEAEEKAAKVAAEEAAQ